MEIIRNTWPKATRMNADNRGKFVTAVINNVMPTEKEPSQDAYTKQWGQTVYDDTYGPHLETMRSLPTWMFMKNEHIWVNVPYNNSNREIEFPVPKGSLTNAGGLYHREEISGTPTLPKDHPATIAYAQLCRDTVDWATKRNELSQQLHTLAAECNTSHQLFRAWPGALKYAEQCFPYVQPSAPKRGGNTTISGQELDIGVMMAKTTVSSIPST